MFTIYNILPAFPQGGTIIEIGAHNGSDTERIYNLIKPEKYIAIEPDPRNIAEIKNRNLPVTLIDGAVGNIKGKTTLYMSGGKVHNADYENTASSSILKPTGHLHKHPEYNFNQTFEVDVITLDEIIEKHNITSIKLIWCDAQGAEGLIIKGGQKALAMTEFFFCEYSDTELYEGQFKLWDWRVLMPKTWEVVCEWTEDILLKRTS